MSRKNKGIIEEVVQTPATKNPLKVNLIKVNPLTDNQSKAFESFEQGKHLVLHGSAGTGKSYISLYLAFKEFQKGAYKKVIIVRSVVPSRDMGFLPGSIEEKMQIFEEPYNAMVSELYSRGDAYDILKKKKTLEFCSTSFLRGITFKDALVIVDEIQNMTFQEADTVITRIGDNCRLILCGDYNQSDLRFEKDKNGLNKFLDIIETMPSFEWIEFGHEDIVRSGLVKEYIVAKEAITNNELQ